MTKTNTPADDNAKKNTGLVKEYAASDLTFADEKLLNVKQLQKLLGVTPAKYKYKRPAKGGGEWTYVTGTYVKKILNVVFGWNWDFQVVNFDMNINAEQCIVHGRLTIRVGKTTIVKEQFGRADIKFKTEIAKDENGQTIFEVKKYQGQEKRVPKKIRTTVPLDLGNDLKAAATDALKKCASEVGVAGDVYGAEEFQQIKVVSDESKTNPDYWRDLVSDLFTKNESREEVQLLRSDAIELEEAKASVGEWKAFYNKCVKILKG